jgi:hypothetical protein
MDLSLARTTERRWNRSTKKDHRDEKAIRNRGIGMENCRWFATRHQYRSRHYVITVDEVIAHYKQIELANRNSKTMRTKDVSSPAS